MRFFKRKYDHYRPSWQDVYKDIARKENWPKDNLCCAPISKEDAWDILEKELLDDDFYVVMPMGAAQVRTEILLELLARHQSPLNRFLSKYFGIL